MLLYNNNDSVFFSLNNNKGKSNHINLPYKQLSFEMITQFAILFIYTS